MNRLEIAVEVMKANVSDMDTIISKETFAKYCFDIAEAMIAEETKRKEEDNKLKEDSEGWIELNGGECPVKGDVLVSVRFREGTAINTYAHNLRWYFADTYDNGCSEADIIAYRVIK